MDNKNVYLILKETIFHFPLKFQMEKERESRSSWKSLSNSTAALSPYLVLSIYPFICQFIYYYIHISLNPFLSSSLSVYLIYFSNFLPPSLSLSPSLFLSLSLSLFLSIYFFHLQEYPISTYLDLPTTYHSKTVGVYHFKNLQKDTGSS